MYTYSKDNEYMATATHLGSLLETISRLPHGNIEHQLAHADIPTQHITIPSIPSSTPINYIY